MSDKKKEVLHDEKAILGGLHRLTEEVRDVKDLESGDIPILQNYKKKALIELVERSATQLPPIYRDTVGTPLVKFLNENSSKAALFWNYYKNSSLAPGRNSGFFIDAVLDVIQAVVQQGGFVATHLTDETKAFQEVISDLYAGFLSLEARKEVKPPDHQKIPPLVKWGNKDFGPYTIPAHILSAFIGVQTAVVSLPPGFATGGIVAFTTLGHESTGHDILNADEGLLEEVKSKLKEGIKDPEMREYWLYVMEEAVSDILGLLHFGPSAALGLIAFFRGWSKNGLLRWYAPGGDEHPIDILRGYLAVEVLSHTSNAKWNEFILTEVNKDLDAGGQGKITLPDGEKVAYSHTNPTSGRAQAIKDSIVQFAQVVMNTKLKALEDHSFSDIQIWGEKDEETVEKLRQRLRAQDYDVQDGFEAAHAVAAATLEGLENSSESASMIFKKMVKLLDAMHAKNPNFPTRNRFRHPVYISHEPSAKESETTKKGKEKEKTSGHHHEKKKGGEGEVNRPPFFISEEEEKRLRILATRLSPTPFYEPAASFDDFASLLFIPSMITVLYEKVKNIRFAAWELAAIQQSLKEGVLKKILELKLKEDDSHPPYIRVAITGKGDYDDLVVKEFKYISAVATTANDNHHKGDYGQATILELWPGKHYSPIHSHGNTTGILLGMAGVLDVVNYAELDWNADKLGMISLTPGKVCWLSGDSFAVHKVYCPLPEGQFGASFHVYINNDELPNLTQAKAFAPSDSRDEFDYVDEKTHELGKFKTYSDLSWPVLRQELAYWRQQQL